MKMIFFVVFLGACSLAAMVLVLLNRSAEKVVVSYVSISIGALAAIFLAVFAFGDQTKVIARFPVCFFINLVTKKAIHLTVRSEDTSHFPSVRRHAAHFQRPTDDWGQTAYHFVLQRTIVEWAMSTYWHTWRVELVEYDLPGPQSIRVGPIDDAPDPTTIIDLATIQSLFPSGSPPTPPMPSMNRLALPPGLFRRKAHLAVKEPRRDPRYGEVAEIEISNDFLTLILATRNLGGVGGLGEYALFGDVPEAEATRFGQLHYEVTVTTVFTPWLAGHPDMPKYRAWATTLIETMRRRFDEQKILQRSRGEQFQSKVRSLRESVGLPAIMEGK